MKNILDSFAKGEEVLFGRDDELLSDLCAELEDSSETEVRIWALEMLRKPLCYLKGRYSTVFGLESIMDHGADIDQKTARTVWKKLMRALPEIEDTADRLKMKSAADFLRTTWEREHAVDAMISLLSSMIWEDGPDEGTRAVPIVVFAAEDILASIRKKIA